MPITCQWTSEASEGCPEACICSAMWLETQVKYGSLVNN